MKQRWMIPMLALALAVTACSSEDDFSTGAGEGQVTFTVDVPAEINQV